MPWLPLLLLACVDRKVAFLDDTGAEPAPDGTVAFTSIQDAIDAAAEGAVIRICPGTYLERLSLSAGSVSLVLQNTILARNGTWALMVYRGASASYNLSAGNVTYDFYFPGERGEDSVFTAGPTDLAADPLFTDAGTGDWALSPGSPARDAGNPDPAGQDLDGSRGDLGIFGDRTASGPRPERSRPTIDRRLVDRPTPDVG